MTAHERIVIRLGQALVARLHSESLGPAYWHVILGG